VSDCAIPELLHESRFVPWHPGCFRRPLMLPPSAFTRHGVPLPEDPSRWNAYRLTGKRGVPWSPELDRHIARWGGFLLLRESGLAAADLDVLRLVDGRPDEAHNGVRFLADWIFARGETPDFSSAVWVKTMPARPERYWGVHLIWPLPPGRTVATGSLEGCDEAEILSHAITCPGSPGYEVQHVPDPWDWRAPDWLTTLPVARGTGGSQGMSQEDLRMITEWAMQETARFLAVVSDTEPLPDEDERGATWRPLDLRELLRKGAAQRAVPDTLIAEDTGECMSYLNATTWIWGQPGHGKTILVLVWAAQQVRAGRHVVWLDFEGQEGEILARLTGMLGCGEDEVVEYFHLIQPDEPFGKEAQREYRKLLALGPSLVVIDPVNNLISLMGGKHNDVDATQQVNRQFLRPARKCGAAAAVVDHVPKDGGEGWPLNSGHKKAVTIVGISVLQMKAFTATQPGYSRLTCYKDRRGTWAIGQVLGFLTVAGGRAAVTRNQVELSALAVREDAELAALVDNLNTLKVPRNAGRTAVRAILRREGIKVGNALLAQAIKARKAVPGQLADSADSG
jgi:AAA domain